MKTLFLIILNLCFVLLNKSYSQNGDNENKIIINDFDPDIALFYPQTDTLKIDMDGDSVNDIMFFLLGASSGNYANVKPLNQNTSVSFINYFPSDSLTGNSLNWYSYSKTFLGEQKYNNTEKIGIKIIKHETTYYGWIRVYFTIKEMNREIHIDKYAFCTIPDYPLMWGQTELTGKKEIKVQDKIKVTVYGQSQNINIQSKEVVGEISLINSEGRVIRKWRNIKSSKVDIPSEGIRGGVYLLRVKTENNEVVTKKMILTK